MITQDVYDYIKNNGPSTIRQILNTGYTGNQLDSALRNLYLSGIIQKTKLKQRGTRPINLYSIKTEYNHPIIRNETHRRCTDCHKWKTHDQFHYSSTQPHNIQNKCKDCNGLDYGERGLLIYDILNYWDSPRRLLATRLEEGPLDTPCLIWTRSTNAKYGQVVINRHNCRVHRIALIVRLKRHIAVDKCASHLCHNPACCEPTHIIEETRKANTRRSVEDGMPMGRGNRRLKEQQATMLELLNTTPIPEFQPPMSEGYAKI